MKKILIVDDHKIVRSIVEATLRRNRRIILHAGSGETAVRIARNEQPQIIIMDILMPGPIDGLEATRILKGDPLTKDSSIIILTGSDDADGEEQGRTAGADHYVLKPFSPIDLIKKVDGILDS